MKLTDWNEVRARALDCINSSLELLTWARDSQQEDYDVGSATLHLAAIDKARNNAENFLGILTIGIDGSSSNSLCQFPKCDQLAQASAGETARPDFRVAATAHEAVFRLLMIALLRIESNLKGGITLEDLRGVSPEKLRIILRDLEKKDSIGHVLGGVGYLHNLQAWIHREWAAMSATDKTEQELAELVKRSLGDESKSGDKLPPPIPKPHWNRVNGELSFDGKVIRSIRCIGNARNVVLVLDTFQELNWANRVDSPLSGGSQQHHATICSLNNGLSLIRFQSDGEGKGVIWKAL